MRYALPMLLALAGACKTVDEGPVETYLAHSTCEFAGLWVGNYMCDPYKERPMVWVFDTNGAHIDHRNVGFIEDWKFQGDSVWVEASDTTECTSRGTYAIKFAADCNSMEFSETKDACPNRNTCLQGMKLTRRPD